MTTWNRTALIEETLKPAVANTLSALGAMHLNLNQLERSEAQLKDQFGDDAIAALIELQAAIDATEKFTVSLKKLLNKP